MTADHITFTLRPGCIEDAPAVVELANACWQEASGIDELSLAEVEHGWRDPAMNLASNTRVAVTPNGEILGCVELWSFPPHVSSWVWGHVLPSRRGQGVGTALMGWAEARALAELERAPAGARVVIETASLRTEPAAIEFMQARGYAATHYSLTMERTLTEPLPTPPELAGLELRAMRPGEELLVYRVVDESFQDHRGFAASAEAATFPTWLHHMTERPGYDPALWRLAIDGDAIVGAALCYSEHAGDTELGWVGTLGVRRPWRRRGVGQALLLHGFAQLQACGCTRVGLGVDAHSLTGATRLYEAVGMRAVREHIGFSKELRAGVELRTESIASA